MVLGGLALPTRRQSCTAVGAGTASEGQEPGARLGLQQARRTEKTTPLHELLDFEVDVIAAAPSDEIPLAERHDAAQIDDEVRIAVTIDIAKHRRHPAAGDVPQLGGMAVETARPEEEERSQARQVDVVGTRQEVRDQIAAIAVAINKSVRA